jgi:hypothetical protein
MNIEKEKDNDNHIVEIWKNPKMMKQNNTNKPQKNREITNTQNWIYNVSHETQLKVFIEQEPEEKKKEDHYKKLMFQQIRLKQNGYKNQDEKKKIYDHINFISFDKILFLLKESSLLCCYCHQPVDILYDLVRKNSQWTLDRIDNNLGHNKDNVVISCLQCNLHRRLMHHKRFKQTCEIGKNFVVKKDHD